MAQRVYNFSPGPAVLPLPALMEAQQDLLALPAAGMSVLEIGHRTKWFDEILETAKDNLRKLLNIPANYHILFLHGGARLQFSMVPMNFLRGSGKAADYIQTGYWGEMAAGEAKREGKVNLPWDGKGGNYVRIPAAAELKLDPNAAYVHFTSNETIQGVQFTKEPAVGNVPLVCDASSDFLCRPLPMEKYALIYACAQKNCAPAGVTIVVIRDDMLPRVAKDLHTMLDYGVHAKNNSVYNTPAVFGVYFVMLVTKWLLNDIGGLDKMLELNRRKSKLLYDAIDQCGGFYQGHANTEFRSLMNVTFRLPDADTEKAFLKGAQERGLWELKGHRSVGGIRASMYNAMPLAGAEALRNFMLEFCKSRG